MFIANVATQNLFGDMGKPVIMKQLINSSGNLMYPEKVSLVVRSLYCTRQARKIWGSQVHKKVTEWNFQQPSQEKLLYNPDQSNHFLILFIIVDDMALASNSNIPLDNFKYSLLANFKAKFFGCLKKFLWMESGVHTKRKLSRSEKISSYALTKAQHWTH